MTTYTETYWAVAVRSGLRERLATLPHFSRFAAISYVCWNYQRLVDPHVRYDVDRFERDKPLRRKYWRALKKIRGAKVVKLTATWEDTL